MSFNKESVYRYLGCVCGQGIGFSLICKFYPVRRRTASKVRSKKKSHAQFACRAKHSNRYVLHSETLTSWFLSHGADPNSVDIQGTTILAWAAFSTSVPIISVLASKGARLEGSRALYAAACSKRPEQISILGFLLDQGMDVNSLQLELPWTVAQHMRPSVRGTALHAAEKFGHRHLVEFLLGRGADPEVRNSEGKTPAEVGESAKKVSLCSTAFSMILALLSYIMCSRGCQKEDGRKGCAASLRVFYTTYWGLGNNSDHFRIVEEQN